VLFSFSPSTVNLHHNVVDFFKKKKKVRPLLSPCISNKTSTFFLQILKLPLETLSTAVSLDCSINKLAFPKTYDK
jgi:hypothetical protein